MELLLKLPKNKAPFVGILFNNEQRLKGERLHAEMVEKYPLNHYAIIFEHTPSALNLRLLCPERVMVYFYNHLVYDAEQLKSWLYFTKSATAFTFGHVGITNNKHELLISQPGRKKFYVKVSSVKFLVADDPYEDWALPLSFTGGK